jgi:hypothetical protein
LHEAAKMITRRLAIDCGRNMEAQVIMPDVFIDAGKRFEVVKNFSQTTVDKIRNRLIKVKRFILRNFS